MKKKKKQELKGKRPKSLERRVADDLVKQHELNDKLREKKINPKFLDIF